MKTEQSSIGAALGRIPSGCSILTVNREGKSTAVLVSWVQQASFVPPAVTVCLKQGRPAIPWVEASQRFLLNVLGAGDNATAMFRHFAKGFTLDEDVFAGLETTPTEFGPAIRSCIAHLGCRVIHKLPVGDHDLFAAEVVWGSITGDGAPYTHIRKNGLSY